MKIQIFEHGILRKFEIFRNSTRLKNDLSQEKSHSIVFVAITMPSIFMLNFFLKMRSRKKNS